MEGGLPSPTRSSLLSKNHRSHIFHGFESRRFHTYLEVFQDSVSTIFNKGNCFRSLIKFILSTEANWKAGFRYKNTHLLALLCIAFMVRYIYMVLTYAINTF